MPLIVEDNLPAHKVLQEEDVFIMTKNRAETQDIRPVDIAILNLMPNKEETEIQILRSISNTPLQINIDLIKTESYTSKNTEEKYLNTFYKNFKDIKNKKYDGMIITGAPVEKMDFEEVAYWEELKEIFEYAKENVYSTMFICWASQAALYYYYDVPKHFSDKKIFGIYEYEVKNKNLLTKGFDDIFLSPQSRHTYTKEEDIKKIKDLNIICSREDTGVCLSTSNDNRFIFVSGHNEYDKNSLFKEYKRDLDSGLEIEKPINYFDDNGNIKITWRSHGNALFSNWINYCVYQDTPYCIDKITGKSIKS
ncbi:homoserine O-succinyltransferase [Peptostreptococcus faecalis]|uniref:homoserine O-succinyltransferase n=1 Tax=Peptostreptococcus faecalis TaxID=2045015 RepID=UPI000C7CEAD3|nr:homoserine O-succinyltransferase [Peptostreptococcus faecalis]